MRELKWKTLKEEVPEDYEKVWIYMPYFPEKWNFDIPDVVQAHFFKGELEGFGPDMTRWVEYWFPVIPDFYPNKAPYFVKP